MHTERGVAAIFVAVLLGVSGATVGVAGLAGAVHPEDAPDMTDQASFVVNLPGTTDHYPGDSNVENGSIEYFASGADAFGEQDAEDGVFIDQVIVHASYEGVDWIDYSACDTPNTEAFGIDRGNNNEGTQYDEDLVSKQRKVDFRDDGIAIDFYNWEDFGDPPYMAPEDAIVAAQGAGSASGPCLTLTSEPGWYRIAAFMNGTVADNGPDERPSADASTVSLELNSNYLYVCECDSEAEAREELGPPPNEEPADGEPTPTPAPTAVVDDEPTPTVTPTPVPDTPTPTAIDDADDGDADEDAAVANDDADGTDEDDAGTGAANDADDEDGADADASEPDEPLRGTPTPGDGPGFTGVAALAALLAGGLLARRRA